jgi:hypothetical protein
LTSHPGRSAALLRRLFYGWLELPEPERPAVPSLVPLPAGTVGRALPAEPPVFVSTGLRDGRARLARFPAALQRRTAEGHLAGAHLLADVDHPDAEWVGSADVLTVPVGRPLRTAGADAWGAVFRRYPGLALLAVEQDSGGAVLVLRDGRRLRAQWSGERPWWATAAAAASVVHDLVMAPPGPAGTGPVRIEVRTGPGCGTGLLDVAAL